MLTIVLPLSWQFTQFVFPAWIEKNNSVGIFPNILNKVISQNWQPGQQNEMLAVNVSANH